MAPIPPKSRTSRRRLRLLLESGHQEAIDQYLSGAITLNSALRLAGAVPQPKRAVFVHENTTPDTVANAILTLYPLDSDWYRCFYEALPKPQ